MFKHLLPLVGFISLTSCATTDNNLFGQRANSAVNELVLIAANKDLPEATGKQTPVIDLPCLTGNRDSIDYKKAQKQLADELLNAGIGLDVRETEETLAWLVNGKFHGDVADLLDLSLHLPGNLKRAALNSLSDLRAFIRSLPDQKTGIQDLYDKSLAKLKRQQLTELLNNDSFARALTIYANINGIPLEQNHIDFLKQELARDDLNMADTLAMGKDKLKAKYRSEFDGMIARLDKSCR